MKVSYRTKKWNWRGYTGGLTLGAGNETKHRDSAILKAAVLLAAAPAAEYSSNKTVQQQLKQLLEFTQDGTGT